MYIVNGKIYTEATLLDEIVYNCKLILKDIVVKNEKLALQYETAASMSMAETRLMCRNNTITFLAFPWTYTMFIKCGATPAQASQYMSDLNSVPEEDRDIYLEQAKFNYVNDFVEQNKYYRSLMGLPEYNTNKYDIYLTESDFPSNYSVDPETLKLPIHEYPAADIEALQSSGRMDEIIEKYRSFNYSYLRYLGAKKIDLDKARAAGKWDILYMPVAQADVQYRFQELYDKNKNLYLVKVYQDAYAFGSEYYDNMMIVMLLAQTFNDMIVDVPEWFIRKDVFDIRTVQYFLEAYNVPFFKEIPLKYQVKIVKSINNLIMSKSTIENFDDILKIFNLRETHIYRYYLYKKHKTDDYGHFIIDPDHPENMYDLEFIEVLLGDTYDNYIKDLTSRVPYDELTTVDEYWDGTEDHDKVKKEFINKDFIVEPTKYITIKADIVYGDYQKQLAYFLSMVLDPRITAGEDIRISVPSISESVNFSLSSLILFIESLCHLYYNTDITIIRPEDMIEPVTKRLPDFEPDIETDDWWMMERYPETFTDKTYNHNRVYGFNPDVDMDAIQELLSRQYTNYTLDNFYYDFYSLYLSNYVVPGEIHDLETLMDVYDNNIACMEKLQFDILHKIDNKDKQKIANYVYNEVYTKSFNDGLYQDDEDLAQVLARKNNFLYNLYQELKIRKSTDPESAANDINTILSDIVSVLSFYLNRPSLDYLFALVSNTSFEAILKYIYWMLDAFKSYKLHFINPITKYISGTPNIQLGNNMEMSDTIFQHTSIYEKKDHMYMWDTITYQESIREVSDYFRDKLFEILDIYTKVEADPEDDYVYDGGSAANAESDYTKMANGGRAREQYPFRILNGFKSYLMNYDEWNLDFNRSMPASHDYNFGDLDNGEPCNVQEDWDFGELGDEGTIIKDCNFGETPDDPGNMQDEEDWNFGELIDDPDLDYNFGEIPGDPGNMYEDDDFGELPDDPGNVEAEWDFDDLDDPQPIIIDEPVIDKECDFGELEDAGNVEEDYDFNIPEDDYALITIDGGNILDHMFDSTATYYENLFKKIYNCGTVNTDKFINNNFFLRIVDDQKSVLAKVATRTGLRYSEDISGNIYLTEYWREWKNINDFEILNDASLLAALYAERRYDLWTQIHDYHELPYGEDYYYVVNHPARKTRLYHLDNLMNQVIDISIEDVYPDGNNITEAEWNFGELPDDPGDVVGDKNFGELPDDSGNVLDDYEFGEISDIYYITKLGNYDSSKVISIPRTI